MNRLYHSSILAVITILIGFPAHAGNLDSAEKAKLLEEDRALDNSFLNFDAAAIASLTFAPFMALSSGGSARFAADIADGYKRQGPLQVRILSQTYDVPDSAVEAEPYDLCVVGEHTVFVSNGRKYRTDGYKLAIRQASAKEWKFVGGNAFKQRPELLRILLPNLPQDFHLPAYYTRPL